MMPTEAATGVELVHASLDGSDGFRLVVDGGILGSDNTDVD
jgi:hypothetical protein